MRERICQKFISLSFKICSCIIKEDKSWLHRLSDLFIFRLVDFVNFKISRSSYFNLSLSLANLAKCRKNRSKCNVFLKPFSKPTVWEYWYFFSPVNLKNSQAACCLFNFFVCVWCTSLLFFWLFFPSQVLRGALETSKENVEKHVDQIMKEKEIKPHSDLLYVYFYIFIHVLIFDLVVLL